MLRPDETGRKGDIAQTQRGLRRVSMNIRHRFLTLMMAVMVAVTYMPAMAFASGAEKFTAESGRVKATTSVSTDDSDALLTGYLEKTVSEKVKSASPEGRGKKAMNSGSRFNRLNYTEKKLYRALSTFIGEVAAGESDTSSCAVSLDLLFDGERYDFTLKELGIDSFTDSDGDLTNETIDAVWSKMGCNEWKVMDALLTDLPYEMYWYDKTAGCASGKAYFCSATGDTLSIYPADDGSFLYIDLLVSPDYSAYGNSGTCAVSTAKTGAAAAFAENAAGIINAGAGLEDIDRLYSYKDAICDAVEYNMEAASSSWTGGYGDPWQLIYVFDGDDSTNVVCEGYAKAFQFLCDRTEFNNKKIEAYTVTGEMDGIAHMWNILHMDDGRRYLADLTNSDAGEYGQPGNLFISPALEGSVEQEYVYDSDGDGKADTSYWYDSDTRSLFTEKELTMSTEAYAGPEEYEEITPEWNEPEYTWSADYSSVTATRTSKDDPSVRESETVPVTHVATKAPTYEAMGETTYTSAPFVNEAFEVQTKTVANIPALVPEPEEPAEPCGKGASAKTAEKAIVSQKSDSDPAGSAFAPLMLKSAKQGKTSVRLTWKKASGAVKYVIYGNVCGKKNKFVRIASTKKLTYNVKKINKKTLKKSKYHKFIVTALDSSGKVVSTSKVIHVATRGKANYTKVKVSSKVKKNKLSLKKGKTFKLAGKAVGRKVTKHVGIRYESSKPEVAKVTGSGKVKGLKKGRCKIYAYAQNGVCTTISVTVK